MKIMLMTAYFPPHLGGVELFTQNLARGLVRLGCDVVVVTSGDKRTVERQNGLTIYRLPYIFRFLSTPVDPRWFWWIRNIIKAERPDVINAHTPVPTMFEIAVRVKGTTPLVATYHAASLFKADARLFNLLAHIYSVIERRSLRRTHSIISPSQYVSRQISLRKLLKPVHTIRNSLWLSPEKPAVQTKANELIFINSLNRSHSWKGLPHIIRAIKAYSVSFPDAEPLHLNVVGDGDLRSKYEKLARQSGVDHLVSFSGALFGAEKLAAIRRAKLLITYPTTSNDAFPTVFLEAWSQSTGIITSAIEPMPSSLKAGVEAVLAPPGDAQALADCLHQTLLDPKLVSDLGSNGYAVLMRDHNWEVNSKLTLELFNKAAAGLEPLTDLTAIVHVAGYYPPHLGGMERVAQELAERLAARHHPVRVLTTNIGAKNRTENLSVPVSYIPAIEIAHVPFAPGLLPRLLSLPRNSIIHLHLAHAFFPDMVMLASAIRRIPYVVHFHLDVKPSGKFGKIFLVYKKTVMTRAIKKASYVVALSDVQRQFVIDTYQVPAERVVTIPNGVGNSFYSNHPRTFAAPLNLLSVGRFNTQKQVQRLVRALPLLNSRIKLHIVGDGEQRTLIEAIIKQHHLTNVIMHGPKYGDELKQLYRDSDIFVIPSDSEGMPLALLEAMAAGLPVIGSNVPGIREVLSGTGVLVDNPSPEAFADAIDALANDKDKLHDLSISSATTASRYNWDEIIGQFELLYKQVAEQRQSK